MGHFLVRVPFSPSTKDIFLFEMLFKYSCAWWDIQAPLTIWLFLQLSLSYKPQHTLVVQQYHFLCHHLDMALAFHLLLLIVDLFINVDCFHLGFAAMNSPLIVVPWIPEMTALDWLCHNISDHLFCMASFDGQLLHIHSIRDEEITNVDAPHTFPTGRFTVPLK
jgi:hypothetical protein